ncbi:hypothetical protein KQX54_017904 [Cotesia glomerata]|uniref:Uncharacterized protein n=1 Tax=Cotesia glomerata TaxID=32391 RepID=A0AAV7IEQ7_COTGL|nr:hypothetical protein KQX54_017904 [Cotesia glomerata]
MFHLRPIRDSKVTIITIMIVAQRHAGDNPTAKKGQRGVIAGKWIAMTNDPRNETFIDALKRQPSGGLEGRGERYVQLNGRVHLDRSLMSQLKGD